MSKTWRSGPKLETLGMELSKQLIYLKEGKWELPPEHVAPETQEDCSGEEFNFSDPDSSDEGSGWETEEEVNDK